MKPVEILKCVGEKLVIEKKDYRGHDMLSVRMWYFNHSDQKWFPSTQGLNMTFRNWRKIMPHLTQLINEQDNEKGFAKDSLK
jgi:hypothetical protein